MHARSKEPGAFPLVITHGWPGSVYEFHKIIGPLTDPAAHGGERERRLPRGVSVDSRLRLLRSDPRARLGRAPRRRDLRQADGAARLRAVRRAGRRLGRDHHHASRRSLDAAHVAGIHLNMVVAGPPPGVANPMEGVAARGDEGARRHGRVPEEGDRLPADPGHQAADARRRAQRFAGRPRGLDRREVPHLERLRRRRREALQQGRAAHQHHDLLGHARRSTRRCGSTARRCARAASRRPASASTAPTGCSIFPKEIYPAAAPLGRGALQRHAVDDARDRAATSPRSRSRPRWSRTSAASSASCASEGAPAVEDRTPRRSQSAARDCCAPRSAVRARSAASSRARGARCASGSTAASSSAGSPRSSARA